MTIDIAAIGDNSGGVDVATQVRDNLAEKFRDLSKRASDLASMIERAPKNVDNEGDANRISEAIRQCSSFLKLANETRIGEKEPFLSAGRAVDAYFQNLGGPVEITKKALLSVRTAYDIAIEREARRQREEAARIAREEAERQAQEARTASQLDRAAVAEVVAQEAEEATKVTPAELTRTRTDTGVTTSLRSEWVHETLDARSVPRKYCVPSDTLLRAAVKAAVNPDGSCDLEIKGVRIYQRRVSQVR